MDLSRLQHLNFKLWKNYTIQLAGAITASAAVLAPMLGKEHPILTYAGIAVVWLMAIAAFIGHFHNVDGTAQSVPGPQKPQLTAPPKDEQPQQQ